jgi:hypothetical protein
MEEMLLGEGQPPRGIVFYTLLCMVIGAIGFIVLISILPFSSGTARSDAEVTRLFVRTLATMLAAGWLGGTLYNMRGLIKHASDKDFEREHVLSYYLRPFAGSISGLIVFFLLLGGALTLNIREERSSDLPSWSTFVGRMPYIALAFLAGYGSHEFMLKLKDLASSLLSLSRPKNEGGR